MTDKDCIRGQIIEAQVYAESSGDTKATMRERKIQAAERFVETVQEGSNRCQKEFLKAELEGRGPEGSEDVLRNSIRVVAAAEAALAETKEMMGTKHRAQGSQETTIQTPNEETEDARKAQLEKEIKEMKKQAKEEMEAIAAQRRGERHQAKTGGKGKGTDEEAQLQAETREAEVIKGRKGVTEVHLSDSDERKSQRRKKSTRQTRSTPPGRKGTSRTRATRTLRERQKQNRNS